MDQSVLLAADISEAWARRGNLSESFAWLHKAEEQLETGKHSGAGVSEVVVAKVRSFIGAAHQLRGDVQRAMEHLQRAMVVQVQHLRPFHSDLLATRLAIARVKHQQGDTDGALRAVEAVEQTLRSGPREGLDLSRALMLKGDLLRVQGLLEAAEVAIHEALKLQNACFQGEDHPEKAVLLNGFGSLLHDSGRAQEAVEKYHEALSVNLNSVGEFHPETAATYNNLGTFFEDVGDFGKAYEYFSKCLAIQVSTTGTASPDVANTYNNIATISWRQGHTDAAASLLRKALLVLDEGGAPDGNPSRAIYTQNLEGVLSGTSAADPHAGYPGPMPVKEVMVA